MHARLLIALLITGASASNTVFLDGVADYLDLLPFSFGGAFSVEAWIFATNPDKQSYIFSFGNGVFDPRFQVGFGSEDRSSARRMEIEIANDPAQLATPFTSPDEFPASRWVHVAIVHDGVSELRVYWDANLKILEQAAPPSIATRSRNFVGRPVLTGDMFAGLVDDIRVWSVARTQFELRQSMFSAPAATSTLVRAFEFEEPTDPSKDFSLLEDSSFNARHSTEGLHCSSTACRVFVTASRVICGDGVRGGDEQCDDGNTAAGDGCSAKCVQEPSWLCLGGEDLVSTDVCEPGTLTFDDGLETGDLSAWTVNTGGNEGSWTVSPRYKLGGQFGLRVKYDSKVLDGCPELIRNGIFRANQASPDASSTGRTGPSSIVSWPISTEVEDPPGSGYVLQLGNAATGSAGAVVSYPIWTQAATGSLTASVIYPTPGGTTYRISAWVMVEGTGTGQELYNGVKNVLYTTFHSSGGNEVASSGQQYAFPSSVNRWERVWIDVTVTSPVSRAQVHVGWPMQSTQGRVWITDISVVPHCPGIPQGMGMWLRADRGVPQKASERVSRWKDQSGLQTDGIAPAPENRPMVRLGAVNGLPSMRFDAGDTGMLFDESAVLMQRPFTVFLVERYSPESTSSTRGRMLQGVDENFILGLHGASRGMYVAGLWVYDGPTQSDADATRWSIDSFVCTITDNKVWLDGQLMGTDSAYIYEPLKLALGMLGRSQQTSDADVAELLLYRRELSEVERQNVESYLAIKYNLPLPYTPRMRTVSQATSDYTLDVLRATVLHSAYASDVGYFLSYGERNIPTPVDHSSVISWAIRLQMLPHHWGIPAWLVLIDRASTLRPDSACFTQGTSCGDAKLFRICFGGGQQSGACDIVYDTPIGDWRRFSHRLSDLFASKYGSVAALPKFLKVVFGLYAPYQQGEVWLDDLRISEYEEFRSNGCPALRAESMGIAVYEGGVATNDLSGWLTRNNPVTATGLSLTAAANKLVLAGTTTQQEAISVFTAQAYFGVRHELFDLEIGLTDIDSAADPQLRICDGEAYVARNPDTGKFEYLFTADTFSKPPSSYIQVQVDSQTTWRTDTSRNLGQIVPWHSKHTYTFFYKTDGVMPYWVGVFFRGGNGDYIQNDASLTRVTGSADRKPAVWQRPYESKLHIRVSTTTSWNNGCDPHESLTVGVWYHIALVFEPNLMQVFYDGVLVCSTTFGANQELYPAPDRDFHTVGHQSTNPYGMLSDFRYYSTSLNAVQIRKIMAERNPINAESALAVGGTSARVHCSLQSGLLRVFENGVLKLQAESAAAVAGQESSVAFVASQTPSKQATFRVSNIEVIEQRQLRGIPVYCSHTGHFYSVVAAEDITQADAEIAAAKQRFLGEAGYLATITSAGENECISWLSNGDSVRVSGRKTGGSWKHTTGPERTQVLSYTNWASAAGQPSGATGEEYVVMNWNTARSVGGAAAVPFGAWVDCEGFCPGVLGYVVEFEPPASFSEDYADKTRYSQVAIVAQSSISDKAASLWTPDLATGQTQMKNNLLVAFPTASQTDGTVSYQFASSDTNQVLVVDLGELRSNVHRVGALFDVTDSRRAVGDFMRVSYSTSLPGTPTGLTGWTLFGEVGTKGDGINDVVGSSRFLFRPTAVSARYIRFEFGRAIGATLASAITSLHIQSISPTFSRLLVNGVDFSMNEPGLNVAVFDSVSYAKQDARVFSLADEANMQSFASFIRDTVRDGDYVLLSAKELPSAKEILFADDFSERQTDDTVRRRVQYDAGRGIYQHLPGYTWNEARQHCAATGHVLCSKDEICRPPGWAYPAGYPHYGWSADGLAYVALDEPNEWLSIGQAFPRADLCRRYSDLHGTMAPDATSATWETTRVMCCSAVEDKPEWAIHAEGVFQHTGGSPTTDTQYPAVWRVYQSQLRIYGHPWGNPSRPGHSDSSRWWHEREQHYLGGQYVYLNRDRAYLWNDYTFSFRVIVGTRGVGGLVRLTSIGNYYRYYFDPESNWHSFVRMNDGEPTELAAGTRQYDQGRWYGVTITAVGSEFWIFLDDELVWNIKDDKPGERHSRGSIALYDWMGYNDYFDNVRVESVSHWKPDHNASIALQSLGAPSLVGIDEGSWAMIGQKGVNRPFVPLRIGNNDVAVARGLFDCATQRRRIPERAKAGSVVHQPLAVFGNAKPGGFYIRDGNNNRTFDIDGSTGQLLVDNSEALDFESTPTLALTVTARESGFDSGWFKLGSQTGIHSFRELSHGMNIDPAFLRVRVRIRAVDGANKGYEFDGTGNAFMTDQSRVRFYGGVLFAYSSGSVRLWAPSRDLRHASGHIINIGTGWGGVYRDGIWEKEMNPQRSHTADVRVIVRPEAPPDYDSGWFPLKSQENSASYAVVQHALGSYPERVKVMVRAVDGPNEFFVFEGAGSAQADRDMSWGGGYGGVVFGYDTQEVRIWAPDYNGWFRGTSRIIKVGQGWGGERHAQGSQTAEVRVLAWERTLAPDFESPRFDMAANVDAYTEIEHGLGDVPERVQVVVSPKVGAATGFMFEGQGMSQAVGWTSSQSYGGVIFAINDKVVRIWAPSQNPQASSFPDNTAGRMVCIFDGWGGEYNRVLEQLADVRVRAWKHETGLEDFARIDVELQNVQEPPEAIGGSYVIDENRPLGGEVGNLQVADGDCPNMRTAQDCNLTFTILSGNVDNAFEVNEFGRILVANESAVNYELREVIAFTVQVFDGLLSTYAMPRFQINNINDRPVIVQDLHLYINESSPVNSQLLPNVWADDEDVDQFILYSIEDGNIGQAFKIGGCDGKIRVRRDILNYEVLDHYNLTVMVVDDGVPIMNATTIVYIHILDINDPPVVEDQTVYVPENMLAGEIVLDGIEAFDEDGDPMTWTIVTGDDYGAFTINATTGHLVIKNPAVIDYETARYATYELIVEVTDGEFVDEAKVLVEVLDRNDRPVITSTIVSIDENSEANTLVFPALTLTDQDPSDTHQWSIVHVWPSVFNGAFEAINNTNQLRVTDLGSGLLDHETYPSVTILVRALDSGGFNNSWTPLFAEKNVTLIIADVNESPRIDSASFSIAENSPVGVLVGRLSVFDEDTTGVEWAQRGLRVRIIGGDPRGWFTITTTIDPADNRTAVPSLVVSDSGIDYESVRNVTLLIEVEDSGVPPLTHNATVFVEIIDANDPPRMLCTTQGTGAEYDWDSGYGYDALSHLLLDPLNADSADGEVVFEFDLAQYGHLQLPPAETCKKACQFAATCAGFTYFDASHPVTGLAGHCLGRNGLYNDPPAYSANHTAVVFGQRRVEVCARFNVSEIAQPPVVFGTIQVIDDEGNAVVASVQNGGGRFGSNTVSTGVGTADLQFRYIGGLLDFETEPKIFVNIMFSDDSGSGISQEQIILVTVLDANELPEYHGSENGVRLVAEGTVGPFDIEPRLYVIDQDFNQSVASFELLTASTLFELDGTTGLFRVKAGQTVPVVQGSQPFPMQIRVTDDAPAPASAILNVTLIAQNMNRPPAFVPATVTATRAIDENSAVGVNVGAPLQATDPDGQTPKFFLVGVPQSLTTPSVPLFRIDRDSGQIQVNFNQINFERRASWTLQVQASDLDPEAPLVAMASVLVTIRDVPEAPYVVDQTLTIAENQPANTVLGQIMWIDQDRDGKPVTFSLEEDAIDMQTASYNAKAPTGAGWSAVTSKWESKTTAQLFDIRAVAAPAIPGTNPPRADPTHHAFELRLKENILDFEGFVKTWQVRVTATDGTLSSTGTITIKTTDVSETPYIDASFTQFSVAENDNGSPVVSLGLVYAHDQDANSTLDLVISDNPRVNGQAVFQLVPATQAEMTVVEPQHWKDGHGVGSTAAAKLIVRAGSKIDYETLLSLAVTIEVRDSTSSRTWKRSSSVVCVDLEDVNDLVVTSSHSYDDAGRVMTGAQAAELATQGGEAFALRGGNFALSLQLLQDIADKKTQCLHPRAVTLFGQAVADDPLGKYTPETPTVTYGGPWADWYSASDCVVQRNTELNCTSAAGVGFGHRIQLTIDGDSVLSPTTVTLAYGLPEVISLGTLDDSSVSATGMSTRGNNVIRLVGRNFGEGSSGAISTAPEVVALYTPAVSYSIPGVVRYDAINCDVTVAHTEIECRSAAGVGLNHVWQAVVGGQTSVAKQLPSTYARPSITSTSVEGGGRMMTTGDSVVVVTGESFGPFGNGTQITAKYGPNGEEYMVNCTLTTAHTEVLCNTEPGVGNHLAWVLVVAEQASDVSTTELPPSVITPQTVLDPNSTLVRRTTSYYAPAIESEDAVDGRGVRNGSTRGGEYVTVGTRHVGPLADQLPVRIALTYLVEYGFLDVGRIYHAKNCSVDRPSPSALGVGSVQCVTAVGTGKNHMWRVGTQVCTSAGTRCRSQWSEWMQSDSSYGPPVVAAVRVLGDQKMGTAGGDLVNITGVNFGTDDSLLSDVMYAIPNPEPNEYAPADRPTAYATNCRLVIPHERLQCDTVPGAGMGFLWTLKVDGQPSIRPAYAYKPPEVHSITGPGASEASTRGGQEVIVTGRNFGPVSEAGDMLDIVTYGPRGSAYTAADCRVTVAHTEIRCMTVPGVGQNLKWRVVVQGQASSTDSTIQISEPTFNGTSDGLQPVMTTFDCPTTSYAVPKITSMTPVIAPAAPAYHSTAGGIRMRIEGANFGPPSDASFVRFANIANQPCSSLQLANIAALPASSTAPELMVVIGASNSTDIRRRTQEGSLRPCARVLSWTHDSVVFETPSGQGSSQPVSVMAQGTESNTVQYAYTAPSITRLVAWSPPLDAITQFTTTESGTSAYTAVTLYGYNFGATGQVVVESISSGPTGNTILPLTDLPVNAAEYAPARSLYIPFNATRVFGHDGAVVAVQAAEGTIRVMAGNQQSQGRVFAQRSPAICPVSDCTGRMWFMDGTENIRLALGRSSSDGRGPARTTAGGFFIYMKVDSMGKVPEEAPYYPTVRVKVDGRSCDVMPLNGTVVDGVFKPSSDYVVLGDSIQSGIVVCVAPPGSGPAAQVVVSHGEAGSASEPVTFAYNPPSQLSYALQNVTMVETNHPNKTTNQHVIGVPVNGTVTITGADLGEEAVVLLIDRNAGYNESAFDEAEPRALPYGVFERVLEVPVTFLKNHSALQFTAPSWQGRNLLAVVDVRGQRSPPLMLSYPTPEWTFRYADPTAPRSTLGGATFLIQGKYLGEQSYAGPETGDVVMNTAYVSVGEVPAECSMWTQNTALCKSPPAGGGQGQEIRVYAGNQFSTASAPTLPGISSRVSFDYDPPVVESDVVVRADTTGRVTSLTRGTGESVDPALVTSEYERELQTFKTRRPACAAQVPAGSTLVALQGSNFGLWPAITFTTTDRAAAGLTDNLAPAAQYTVPACWMVHRNHTHALFYVPPLGGDEWHIGIRAVNQHSALPSSAKISYNPPVIAQIMPKQVPTDGCYSWEQAVKTNATDTSGLNPQTGQPRRMCCDPAMVTIEGSNFGDSIFFNTPANAFRFQQAGLDRSRSLRVSLNGVVVSESCADVALRAKQSIARRDGLFASRFTPLTGYRCSDKCFDIVYRSLNPLECSLHAESGEKCCVYQRSSICQCPVPSGACVLEHTHNRISIRPPAGFGRNKPMIVRVGGLQSAVQGMNYADPSILSVDQQPYYAEGETITIRGANFGYPALADKLGSLATANVSSTSTSSVALTADQLALQNDVEAFTMSLDVDSTECVNATLALDANGDAIPFIRCTTQRDVTGFHNATLNITGVTGEVKWQSRHFWSECPRNMYGLYRPAPNTQLVSSVNGTAGSDRQFGELCLPCPTGGVCVGGTADARSAAGYWKLPVAITSPRCPAERQQREDVGLNCFSMVPCDPAEACVGANKCSLGYDDQSAMCQQCSEGFYKLSGVCIPCPDRPWLIVLVAIAAAIGLCIGGYFLNKKAVNMGIVSIMVDYMQILAIFGRSRIKWPAFVTKVFQWMSAFNFNLDLAAPECAMPDLEYQQKWLFIEALPIFAIALFTTIFACMWLWQRVIKRQKASLAFQMEVAQLTSMALTMFYFLYLYLARTTFEVFNCIPPPDGNALDDAPHGSMQAEPSYACYVAGSPQMALLPWALITMFVYALGYPIVVGIVLWRNRRLVQVDQLLRAQGTGDDKMSNPAAYLLRKRFQRVYYNFKPECWYWILIIIGRKFCISVTALMFNTIPAFQLSLALLVLFAAYTLQVMNRPYMSMSEREDVLEHWRTLREQGHEVAMEVGKQLDVATKHARQKGRKVARLNARSKEEMLRDAGRATAAFVHNYNTVEATLLGCAVFITLSGIMFGSGRLDAEHLREQRDTLAVLVGIVLVVSVLYAMAVLVYDIMVTISPDLCTRKRKKEAAQEEETDKVNVVSNPMMTSNLAPSEQQWNLFRAEYQQAEEALNKLKQLDAEGPKKVVKKTKVARSKLGRKKQFGQVMQGDDDAVDASTQRRLSMAINPIGSRGAENADEANIDLFAGAAGGGGDGAGAVPDDQWDEHIDPATGHPYYLHKTTGESRWERPTLPSTLPATAEAGAVKYAAHVDPSSGHTYYLHPETGASSWTLPDGGVVDHVNSTAPVAESASSTARADMLAGFASSKAAAAGRGTRRGRTRRTSFV